MSRGADETLIGRTIAGKYQLEALLGQGAMGAVYKARQLALDKVIAVKVMHQELGGDPTFPERFKREAKASSKLDHPNSIRVIDYGEDGGLLYIALEYLAGRNLLDVIRCDWPLSTARIVEIVTQALAALAVAHDLGIVHRDLKPENIMVLAGATDDGQPIDIVKVCDFGIAKISDPRSYQTDHGGKGPLTQSGSIVGTPEYMSPEQGRGDKLDPRSDIYSVGVILYHLLTRRVPFEAESAIGIILKHITEEPVRPCALNPGADPALEEVCLKAMRKHREDRFASARDMRAQLRLVQEELRLDVPPPRTSASAMRMPPATDTGSAPTAVVGALPMVPALRPAIPTPSPSQPGPAIPPIVARATTTHVPVQVAAPARRGKMVAVVALLATLAAPALAFTVWKVRHTPAPEPVAASHHEEPVSEWVALAPIASLTPVDSLANPNAPNVPKGVPPNVPPVGPTTKAKLAQAPSAVATAQPPAPSAALVAPIASKGTPPAASVVAPVVSASVAPAPPPPPPSAVAAASDPTYLPDRAWVELGMVNPTNVAGNAVSAALKQANLTACYRAALRTRGARVAGYANLNLSIDQGGVVRGAMLSNNDFLREATACVQNAATGVRLRKGAIEDGTAGATAEVMLIFHPE